MGTSSALYNETQETPIKPLPNVSLKAKRGMLGS